MKIVLRNLLIAQLLFAFMLTSQSVADDWPQFRGPNRDDVSKETGLLKQWPDGGPTKIWTHEKSGLGYSGFSIVDGRLFTMGLDSVETFVICLDADNGKEIWRTKIGEKFSNGWGNGPRSTPTVDGDHVYALSAKGMLMCLNKKDGKQVWKQSMKDFGGKVPSWGYSESVLIDGDLVLCTPGGSRGTILALDKKSGDKVWQSSEVTEPAHYSSIIKVQTNMKTQYVQLTPKKVFGVSDKGRLLWSSEWRGSVAVIPTPIFNDGKVYICSGYGAGSKLIDISEVDPDEKLGTDVWDNRVMKNQHGGVILLKDHLYGYSDKVGWTCQDWETGEMVWSEKRSFRKGAIGYADDRFYCQEEKTGEVALIDASSEGWKERGRFKMEPQSPNRSRRGAIWVHPTISNGKLYLRDQEYIHCYDIRDPGNKNTKSDEKK
jgi:outer membrane protein assembly factor BamB